MWVIIVPHKSRQLVDANVTATVNIYCREQLCQILVRQCQRSQLASFPDSRFELFQRQPA
jgi:hypothetical protein